MRQGKTKNKTNREFKCQANIIIACWVRENNNTSKTRNIGKNDARPSERLPDGKHTYSEEREIQANVCKILRASRTDT